MREQAQRDDSAFEALAARQKGAAQHEQRYLKRQHEKQISPRHARTLSHEKRRAKGGPRQITRTLPGFAADHLQYSAGALFKNAMPRITARAVAAPTLLNFPLALCLVVAINAAAARNGLLASPWGPVGLIAFVARFALGATLPALGYAILASVVDTLLASRTTRSGLVTRLAAHALPALALAIYLWLWLQRGDAVTTVALVLMALGLCVAQGVGGLTQGGWRRFLPVAAEVALLVLGVLALLSAVSETGMRYRPLGTSATIIGTAYCASGLGLLRVSTASLLKVAAGFVAAIALSFIPASKSSRSAAAALSAVGRAETSSGYSERQERRPGAVPAVPDGLQVLRRVTGLPRLDATALAKYNFLLVTTEAARFDETSLANPTRGSTPHLLEWAQRDAFVFTRAYSPSNGTLASMSSLLSLTYPAESELNTWRVFWRGELRPKAVTLAELFGRAGATTFRVSHNFQSTFDKTMLGFEQGFDTNILEGDDGLGQQGKTLDSRIADAAIGELQKARASGHPFFGWVFFGGPHAPYDIHYADAPSATPSDRYRQELRFMDQQLERLLSSLEQLGLAQNTIVLFAADHGEELYDHGGAGHHTLYEECIHVPLVIHVPGERGERIETPTSTLSALLWLMSQHATPIREASEQKLSREVAPLLAALEGATLIETLGHDMTVSAMIRGQSKAICDIPSDWCDVYDLQADPKELHPLPSSAPEAVRWRQTFERYMAVRGQLGRFTTEPTH